MTEKPTIKLFNTLTKRKEELRQPTPGKPITMYVCGPTVYGRAHIGNARPAVVFDVLYRLLRHVHGPENVRYARNITDIDDKIMARAVAENRTSESVAREYEQAYHDDMAALGCLPPDFTPRATDHIEGDHGMIGMIAELIARGAAYAAEGHVLFEVEKYPSYGTLSRRPLNEMIAGARVEIAPYKRAPADFVLWKPSTPDQPGWESPWGRGRPGWHIECSAMIRAVLGETIDIHGGGIDLMFPHHENERAQSCCATGQSELATIWMHNGFLTMGETKMSKSLGNIVTPRELLDAGWAQNTLRMALLTAKYRRPLSWDDELLRQSRARINYLLGEIDRPKHLRIAINAEIVKSLEDDINTPDMLANFYNLRVERGLDSIYSTLLWLGFAEPVWDTDDEPPERSLRLIGPSSTWPEVEGELLTAVKERNAAKLARNFAEADRIRADLLAQGIILEDHRDGTTTWRRA